MTDEKTIENTAIDWVTEANNLKTSSNWLKLKAGTHKILFLSNGELTMGKDFNGKPVQKINFDIEYNKEQMKWGMNRNNTEGSLSGQIALVARAKGGKLSGVLINVSVKGTGKSTQYMVHEALSLMSSTEAHEEPEPQDSIGKAAQIAAGVG